MIVPGRDARRGDSDWRPVAGRGVDPQHLAAPAGDHECPRCIGGRHPATVGELHLVHQATRLGIPECDQIASGTGDREPPAALIEGDAARVR
jgi:hypothetical protein